MVGAVVKAKVGELEDEVTVVFSRRTRRYFTGVLQLVSGKRIFLVIFHDRCKKYLTSNQLTVVIVDRFPVTK